MLTPRLGRQTPRLATVTLAVVGLPILAVATLARRARLEAAASQDL